MKKVSFVLLILLTSLFAVFAGSELFNQTSDEVVLLEHLYRQEGQVMPSVIYPVTGDYLLSLADKLETGLLSINDRNLLNNLIDRLEGSNLYKVTDDFMFDGDLYISPLIVVNSGSGFEDYTMNRIMPLNEIPAIVKGTADLQLIHKVFGHFEYEYSKQLAKYFKSGIILNNPLGVRNMTVPYNTYLSAGSAKFNVYAGRVRNSSGNGVTGNLAIGDNFLYRDAVKLGIFTHPFTYEFLINTFEHETGKCSLNPYIGEDRPIIIIHKATFTPWSNFSLGLYEGMLDYSSASPFDPKIINPFLLLHNLLTYKTGSNNFFGAEFDWAFADNLSLHTQFIFDQINLRGEGIKGEPSAFGIVANLQYASKLWSNPFDAYFELAYTNPWLYLKTTELSYHIIDDYDYHRDDLFVGNYQTDGDFDTGYIGYKYGPNTIVLDTGFKYKVARNDIGFDFLLRLKGDTGLDFATDMAVGDSRETKNAVSPYCYVPGDKRECLIQLTLSDKITCLDGAVEIHGAVGLQEYLNYRCKEGDDKFNVQLNLGVTVKPIDLFKK